MYSYEEATKLDSLELDREKNFNNLYCLARLMNKY